MPVNQKSSAIELSKLDEFEKDLLTYAMHSHPKEILFGGICPGYVCKICCSTDGGNLFKCSACGDHVHMGCLDGNMDDSVVALPERLSRKEQRRSFPIKIRVEPKLLCNECRSSQFCFGCKECIDTEFKQCNVRSCNRSYHTECLNFWKQSELTAAKLKCPVHVCHTCVATKDSNTTTQFTFCVKCPTAYHLHSSCIPAGTKLLTKKHHICVRHRAESRRTHSNFDFCAGCGEDGELNA